MSADGPSRHTALPQKCGRKRGIVDIATIAHGSRHGSIDAEPNSLPTEPLVVSHLVCWKCERDGKAGLAWVVQTGRASRTFSSVAEGTIRLSLNPVFDRSFWNSDSERSLPANVVNISKSNSLAKEG